MSHEQETCSFIIMNMGNVVYFESIPHKLACCQKHLLEHSMC